MFIEIISGIFIPLNIIGIIVFFIFAAHKQIFDPFNPKVVYEHINVNWFGAWFIAILLNITFSVSAVCYWFYVLCTFGREDR